ncbi:DUF4332 domain-containing protein [Phaeodactylibacter luteus]|nr:DUF4332 domain-containing protein [Phaeodactylibacter luteus]
MLKKQYLKSKPACKVTFTLPVEAAEGAKEVKVLGDFNNWSWEEGLTMKASKAEYKAVAELEAGQQYQFRYMIDKAYWKNDYQADAYVPSPYGGTDNSLLVLDPIEVAAPATEQKAAPAKKAAPKKAAAKSTTAATAKAQPKAAKDDLKKLEGIGPKIAGLLTDAGFATFTDLAKAKPAALKAVLEAAGPRYKMHDSATWTEQAKLAAKGAWDELSALQKELKGGKRKK